PRPWLSQIRSRDGTKTLLRHGLPRRADRSGLRGPRIIRRFPHDLLHRSRIGILFSSGGGRRNLRLLVRLAEATAKPALRALSKRLAVFPGADPLFPVQPALASFHSLDTDVWLARSSRPAAAGAAFPYQLAARGAKGFDHARANECLSELSLSLRRKTRVRSDNYLREPSRRKNVRTIRVQGFESGRDDQIQSVLSRIGLPEYRHQKSRNGRSAFRLLSRSRVTEIGGKNRSGVQHRFN